jgi:hypothetical protein
MLIQYLMPSGAQEVDTRLKEMLLSQCLLFFDRTTPFCDSKGWDSLQPRQSTHLFGVLARSSQRNVPKTHALVRDHLIRGATGSAMPSLANQQRRILHAPPSATRDTATNDNQCPYDMPIIFVAPLLKSASLLDAG